MNLIITKKQKNCNYLPYKKTSSYFIIIYVNQCINKYNNLNEIKCFIKLLEK